MVIISKPFFRCKLSSRESGEVNCILLFNRKILPLFHELQTCSVAIRKERFVIEKLVREIVIISFIDFRRAHRLLGFVYPPTLYSLRHFHSQYWRRAAPFLAVHHPVTISSAGQRRCVMSAIICLGGREPHVLFLRGLCSGI